MIRLFKITILLWLSALFMSGCGSTPETKRDPFNPADSQRDRASQTQGELSREMSK